MAKRLISEQLINELVRRGQRQIVIDSETIFTPSAIDRLKQFSIKIVKKGENNNTFVDNKQIVSGKGKIIVVGSDHGGFQLKMLLIPYIKELGYEVIDVGTNTEETCDYPDFAYTVAKMVSNGQAIRGIMIDAIGNASAMVANKVKGIRAVCCFNEFSARSSREHNNANVLTLGGRILGAELAKSITKIWLETEYVGGRHQSRLDKIADIEKKEA